LNALAARAKEAGLAMDQDFLDKIKFVLNYGYKEQLEAKVYFLEDSGNNYYSFSSPLKRNYLKEDEHLIVSKFSRYSEKEFVIFGMITQSKENQSGVPVEQNTNSQDFKHIKQAISQLISGILHVEEQFLGKVENEVLIDPIAIYREI
jgi:muramoyltetrapeptide carboxypeptidase LdcA involved in peptidoglycan recycling